MAIDLIFLLVALLPLLSNKKIGSRPSAQIPQLS